VGGRTPVARRRRPAVGPGWVSCLQRGSGLRLRLVRLGSQSDERSPFTFASPRSTRPWLRDRVLLLTAVAAVVLAFFALFRVDFSGGALVSFRHQPVWQSTETLRATAPMPVSTAAHHQRLRSLTLLYAALVNSSVIRDRARRSGPLEGQYEASTSDRTNDASWRGPGPFLSIQATAGSPAHAAQTATRVSRSARAHIAEAEHAAQVPQSARVRLEVVSAAREATLVRGRRLTGPLAALTGVLVLLGLAALSRSRPARH
jgi:hypothetical protein